MFRAFFKKIKVFLAGGKSNNNLRELDLTSENLASELSKAEGMKIPVVSDLQSNYEWPKDKSTPVDFINIPSTNSKSTIIEPILNFNSVNFNSVNSDNGCGLAEYAFQMDDHEDLPSQYPSSTKTVRIPKGILRN
jgi:hypothetical protein